MARAGFNTCRRSREGKSTERGPWKGENCVAVMAGRWSPRFGHSRPEEAPATEIVADPLTGPVRRLRRSGHPTEMTQDDPADALIMAVWTAFRPELKPGAQPTHAFEHGTPCSRAPPPPPPAELSGAKAPPPPTPQQTDVSRFTCAWSC